MEWRGNRRGIGGGGEGGIEEGVEDGSGVGIEGKYEEENGGI